MCRLMRLEADLEKLEHATGGQSHHLRRSAKHENIVVLSAIMRAAGGMRKAPAEADRGRGTKHELEVAIPRVFDGVEAVAEHQQLADGDVVDPAVGPGPAF